jgi:hypothetical protein
MQLLEYAMSKYRNIVAASILGVSLIFAALIVNGGLRNASNTIQQGMAFPPMPRFPDRIAVVNGNSSFDVELRTPYSNQQPIKVEVGAPQSNQQPIKVDVGAEKK